MTRPDDFDFDALNAAERRELAESRRDVIAVVASIVLVALLVLAGWFIGDRA